MNYILFDDNSWTDLQPLTFTRPVSKIRCGILTMQEKWEKYLGMSCSHHTQTYLQEQYPMHIDVDNILINGSIFPDKEIISAILTLQPDETLINDYVIVAKRLDKKNLSDLENTLKPSVTSKRYQGSVKKLSQTWDIFSMNGEAIKSDFQLLVKDRQTQPLNESVNVFGNYPVFIEEGANLHFVHLNTTNGPIYIGKNAEIMEGSLIRGPFAICEESIVKMGAKIYGPTTIGPVSYT